MSSPQEMAMGLMLAQVKEILLAEVYGRVAHIPMLAHYTSLDVFKSILRGKELWFSRVKDMSDTSEVREGGEIVAASLEKNGPRVFKSFRYSETDTQQRFASFQAVLEAETYVLSLCEHGSDQRTDRLTMWRAYGHDGNGLCLVLRKDTLLGQSAAGKFPVHWSPIEYETPNQLAERVLRRLNQIEEVFGKAPQGVLASVKSVLGSIVTGCILSLVLAHKNEAYSDEKEVRFIRSPLLQTVPPPEGAGYRNVGTVTKPRDVFVLPLRDYPEFPINASLPALLDHVILGPSHQQDAMHEEVAELLRVNNLSHVKIIRSSIPYRANR